jgi:hypothetical protein
MTKADWFPTIAILAAILFFEGGLLLAGFSGHVAIGLLIGTLSIPLSVAALVSLRIFPAAETLWVERLASQSELLFEEQPAPETADEGTPFFSSAFCKARARYGTLKLRIGEQLWNDRLRRSGWRAENWGLARVTLPEGFDLFPAAERVLAKYGGCHLKVSKGMEVLIDPRRCVDEYSQLAKEFSHYLGEPVYPIGIFEGQDDYGAVITPKGHVYTLLPQVAWPLAANFEDALLLWLFGDVAAINRAIGRRKREAGMRDCAATIVTRQVTTPLVVPEA